MKQLPSLSLRSAGVASAFELALRFTAWASQFPTDPTAKQIMARWEISQATAYRWLAAWRATRGTASRHKEA